GRAGNMMRPLNGRAFAPRVRQGTMTLRAEFRFETSQSPLSSCLPPAKERILTNRDIVVVGGSAGSIEALMNFLPDLPRDLRAAIFVVIHTAPESPGYLAEILTRAGRLPARYAQDGELFAEGRIYVAPPDRHMLLNPGQRMQVVRGPRENRTRPSIDPLFRS